MAGFAKLPLLARLRRSQRFSERDGIEPDNVFANRTACRFVPASPRPGIAFAGNRNIISWYHNSSLAVLSVRLPA